MEHQNNLPASPIEKALDQKREYLTKNKQDDTLKEFNKQLKTLMPELQKLPEDQQKQIADRVKNFQISERRKEGTLKESVDQLLALISRNESSSDTGTIVRRAGDPITNRRLDKSDSKFDEHADSVRQDAIQQRNLETFNDTISTKIREYAPIVLDNLTVPSTKANQDAFITALGQKENADMTKWDVTFFQKGENNKQPNQYYRRGYYINYNDVLTTTEIQRRENVDRASIRDGFSQKGDKVERARERSLMSRVDGRILETITGDIPLPSPEEMATLVYQTAQEGKGLLAIQKQLGYPYLELRNLAAYYLAEQRGYFNEKEIKAVRYLEKVIIDKYKSLSNS